MRKNEVLRSLHSLYDHSDGLFILLWVVFSSGNGSERKSELFSLPLKSSKGNSESFLLFWFLGTEFRVVFFPLKGSEGNSESLLSLPRKGSERNSESFLFRVTAWIPSEITICSVYFVFRGITFLSEIPNPTHSQPDIDRTCIFLWPYSLCLSHSLFRKFNAHLLNPSLHG